MPHFPLSLNTSLVIVGSCNLKHKNDEVLTPIDTWWSVGVTKRNNPAFYTDAIDETAISAGLDRLCDMPKMDKNELNWSICSRLQASLLCERFFNSGKCEVQEFGPEKNE